MADNRLEIEIVLDDGSVRKGFARVLNEGKDAAKGLDDAFASFGKRLAAVAAGYLSFQALKRGISESISAAIEADAALAKMNNQLALAGLYTPKFAAEMEALSGTIQKTTTISDDQAQAIIGLAANYGKTEKQVRDLTTASIDLAAATGKDVETAVRTLGMSLNGTSAQLGKLVPSTKAFTEEQLKAGAAIDLVASRFKGAAAAEANTFGGRLAQLKNIFGDLLEEVGRFVTKSPALVGAMAGISKVFVDITNKLGTFRAGGGDFLKPIIKDLLEVGRIAAYIFEGIYNVGKLTFDVFKTGFQAILASFAGVAGDIVKFFAPNSTLAQNLAMFTQSADEQLKVFASSAGESFAKLTDFSISEKASAYITDIQTMVESTKTIGAEIKNQAKVIDSSLSDVQKSINKTFQDGILKTISAAMSYVGQSLAKGKFSFEAFGGAVLSIIGDMAIQIGTTLVGIGISIDALKTSLVSLSGGQAVAAGLALIAIGGLLKSLSGGGSQGATSGPVAAGGGGGYVPVEPTVNPSESVSAEKPGPRVTVVVNGSIMDSRESGMRIVELINEAGFESGNKVFS